MTSGYGSLVMCEKTTIVIYPAEFEKGPKLISPPPAWIRACGLGGLGQVIGVNCSVRDEIDRFKGCKRSTFVRLELVFGIWRFLLGLGRDGKNSCSKQVRPFDPGYRKRASFYNGGFVFARVPAFVRDTTYPSVRRVFGSVGNNGTTIRVPCALDMAVWRVESARFAVVFGRYFVVSTSAARRNVRAPIAGRLYARAEYPPSPRGNSPRAVRLSDGHVQYRRARRFGSSRPSRLFTGRFKWRPTVVPKVSRDDREKIRSVCRWVPIACRCPSPNPRAALV